jgi:hypothetical protein
LNFLSEKINYYNPLVEELYLGGGNRTYISKDTDYNTKDGYISSTFRRNWGESIITGIFPIRLRKESPSNILMIFPKDRNYQEIRV